MDKIGIMLSGKEVREVYMTLLWVANGDVRRPLKCFKKYCSPQKHILYERYMFWNIKQEETEIVDAYLTHIKLKLNMCKCSGEVRQEMTHDKFSLQR